MTQWLSGQSRFDEMLDGLFRTALRAERRVAQPLSHKVWQRIQQQFIWSVVCVGGDLPRTHFSIAAINHPIARMCTLFSMSGRAAGLV